jgi:hypothetical protein
MIMLFMVMVLLYFTAGVVMIVYARHWIIASWREPVLRRPVLIIESDDWGAGPDEQARAVGEIAGMLAKFSDSDGRRAVMTLGIVLATADGERTLGSGRYHRALISEHTHGALLEAIKSGVDRGVFSLQLHGMEHYWPPALVTASKTDDAVMAWLKAAPASLTEDLPSPLQSRWVDASELPSRPLSRTAVQQAAREEVDIFQKIFRSIPFVAVPPTFIWNEDVENAWAAAGVKVIVTPGARFDARDGQGRPAGRKGLIYNGQYAENNILYLVRDVYFEPSLGHVASQAFVAFEAKTRLGRPAVFETHRFNFIGTVEKRNKSIAELGYLLRMAVENYSDLAFLPSDKLAMVLKKRSPEWTDSRFRRRLHVCITRLGEIPRLRKLAWLTGWILPVGLLWRLTG